MQPNQETVDKWQQQVDLLALLVKVPVALVTKADADVTEALVANRSEKGPWQSGVKFPTSSDLYCYYVILHDRELLVPNALKDSYWAKSSEVKMGMLSYYGVPIHAPNGSTWGTLCVMDEKENFYATESKALITLFRDSMEKDMLLLARNADLETMNSKLQASYLDLKNTQDTFFEREKNAALGEIVAGVAHEIKNPLQFAICNAQFLTENLNDCLTSVNLSGEMTAPMRSNLNTALIESGLLAKEILLHSERIDSIIKSMLSHSRYCKREETTISDLNILLKNSFNLAYFATRSKSNFVPIQLQEEYDATLSTIEICSSDLGRAFINIILNALYELNNVSLRESTEKPTIRLKTERCGEYAVISIRDNGPGISSEIRKKIFLPFFTTKPANQGTGLGLSICKKIIVEDHGGVLELDSCEGKFSEFIIKLPLITSSSAALPLAQ